MDGFKYLGPTNGQCARGMKKRMQAGRVKQVKRRDWRDRRLAARVKRSFYKMLLRPAMVHGTSKKDRRQSSQWQWQS